MRFSNPHSSFIRVAYGMVIETLQGVFLLGYLAASYYFFKYGDEFGLDQVLNLLGVSKPKIWIWLFITFLYAACFALLGTLSAIASAEHSLHLLAKKSDFDEELWHRKCIHVSILYYFNDICIEDDEIKFDTKLGAHRSHSSTGFMVIKGKLPQQRNIGNFWGLLGRKDVNFFQFSKKAFVTFIEPTDLSKLQHNNYDTTDIWINTKTDDFADALFEILVDGRFIRSLKKLFPVQISEGKNENRYATVYFSGTYFFKRNKMSNIRLSSLSVWDWARYTPKQLQESFNKDADVPDALKTKIQNAIFDSSSV